MVTIVTGRITWVKLKKNVPVKETKVSHSEAIGVQEYELMQETCHFKLAHAAIVRITSSAMEVVVSKKFFFHCTLH